MADIRQTRARHQTYIPGTKDRQFHGLFYTAVIPAVLLNTIGIKLLKYKE
jgi:hypothetical protein